MKEFYEKNRKAVLIALACVLVLAAALCIAVPAMMRREPPAETAPQMQEPHATAPEQPGNEAAKEETEMATEGQTEAPAESEAPTVATDPQPDPTETSSPATSPVEPSQLPPPHKEPDVEPAPDDGWPDIENPPIIETRPDPETCEHNFIEIGRKVNESWALTMIECVDYRCTKCGYQYGSIKEVVRRDITAADIAREEEKVIKLINEYRVSNGLKPLLTHFSNKFDQFAKTRAQELSIAFGHRRPDGGAVAMEDGAYYVMGDLVQNGCEDAETIFDRFKNSPGHNGTMLLPDDYGIAGVAVGIYVDREKDTAYCDVLIIGKD